MPRVHTVQRARASKKSRKCRTCGAEIKPGESYRYAEPYTGPMLYWCHLHTPTRGQLTTSHLGPLYDEIDSFSCAEASTLEEVKETLQPIVDLAREIASQYEESIGNMPEGLQEGPTAEDMSEKQNTLEEYADELESWEPSTEVEEFNEEEVREEVEGQTRTEMLMEWEDNGELAKAVEEDEFDPDEDDQDEFVWDNFIDLEAYETRVNEEVEVRRAKHEADNPDILDGVRDEAVEAVNNLEL